MEIPSLIIKGNKGRCSMCPLLTFIAAAGRETPSLLEQFEVHCREAHPSKGEHVKRAAEEK